MYEAFDYVCLASYLCPRELGFDNGQNAMVEFLELCNNTGLKQRQSFSWNPQSNVILERIHQVIADCR